MKLVRSALTIAVVALFASQAVHAQTKSREEVKKEAAAANKAGTTVEKADAKQPVPAKAAPSASARADVKKEAAAATKAGTTVEKADAKQPVPTKAAPSASARADVKKEAAAATKAGTTETGTATAAQKAEEGVKPKK